MAVIGEYCKRTDENSNIHESMCMQKCMYLTIIIIPKNELYTVYDQIIKSTLYPIDHMHTNMPKPLSSKYIHTYT